MSDLDGLTRKVMDRTYAPKPRRRVAYVGKQDNTIDVPGRDYYIYVRASQTRAEYVVYDPERKAPRFPGVPVYVKERENAPGRYEVEGISSTTPPATIAASVGSAALIYGGADQLIVDQRQIKQGQVHQTSPASMKYTLNGFTVWNSDGATVVDTQTSGTISAPASGFARWDAVSIDPSDWSLTTTTGTPYNKDFPELGAVPDVPAGEMYFGKIRITDTTTELRDGRNIEPAPPYFTEPASSGASALDDLDDAAITSAADGDALIYDSSSSDFENVQTRAPVLIESQTLSTTASSVTFSTIPTKYRVLVLDILARTDRTGR